MSSFQADQRRPSSSMGFAPAQQRVASKQRPDIILVDPQRKGEKKSTSPAAQNVTMPWVVSGVAAAILIAGMVAWVTYWTTVAPAVAPKPEPVAEEPKPEPGPTPAMVSAAMLSAPVHAPIPEPGERATLVPVKLLANPSEGIGATAIAPRPEPIVRKAPAGVIPWNQASQYMGQEVTVEGTIVDAKNTGSVCQLTFSKGKDSFYLAVFEKAMTAWGEKPEKLFLGKTVQVTGTVTSYKDRPQIRIESGKQVTIVGGSTAPVAAAVAAVPVAVATVSWSQATKYIGQTVAVEGVIVDSGVSRSKNVFLNFSGDRGSFYVLIPEAQASAFAVAPQDHFRGKKIRVTGRVTTYQDRPQIKIDGENQIVVID